MMKRFLVFLILSLVILDRLTKYLALDSPHLFENPKLYFIPLNSVSWLFLIGIVLGLFLFLFFESWQRKDFLLMTGFSLIILGGLSNFLDRIIFGYVIDWLRIFFLPISVFNLADLMIIGGVIILLVVSLRILSTKGGYIE
jgi:lipoprotein signal peptidase